MVITGGVVSVFSRAMAGPAKMAPTTARAASRRNEANGRSDIARHASRAPPIRQSGQGPEVRTAGRPLDPGYRRRRLAEGAVAQPLGSPIAVGSRLARQSVIR